VKVTESGIYGGQLRSTSAEVSWRFLTIDGLALVFSLRRRAWRACLLHIEVELLLIETVHLYTKSASEKFANGHSGEKIGVV
jgi:hypothetical protein